MSEDARDRIGTRLGEIARARRATSPCLDAETLAGWADGGLTTEAALGVETHLASCPECRAIAVLLRTTDAGETAPAAPPAAVVDIASVRPASGATAAPRRRWVLPAGIGAAAAVALWFATAGRNPATPSLTYTQPMSETAPRSAPSDARAGGGSTFGQGQASRLAPRAAPDSANQLSQERLDRTAPPSPDASLESSLAKSRADIASPARQRETQVGGRSAVGAREMVAEAPVAVAALPAAPPPPAAPLPPPPAASASAAATSPAAGPIPAPAEAFARSAAPLMRSVGGIASDPRFVVSSPDGTTEWRVRADNRLERAVVAGDTLGQTRDATAPPATAAGASAGVGRGGQGRATAPATPIATSGWETLALPPGVILTAGSSPSRDVSWFVGRSGAVFVTDPASGLRRVGSPSASDITTVLSTSNRSATVVTSDGRRFSTDDGGATWRANP